MHGDPRHAQSRSRRGNGQNASGNGRRASGNARSGNGTGPGRAPGALPEPADLARVLEPVVRAAGMDLESVRVSPAGRRRLLKLVVDADGGVGLDAIAEVSREVSARLDASGAMGEAPYTLEVSSPGVDRPLTEPRHWRRALGRLVSAPLAAVDGADPGRAGAPRRAPTIRGRVLLAGDTSVTLDIEGDRVELDYAELGPGQVQVEFGRASAADAEAGATGTETGATGTEAAATGTEAGPMLDRVQPGNGGGQDGH
jgi:ribosome maturation factor RimP